jgi:hypothetical protein
MVIRPSPLLWMGDLLIFMSPVAALVLWDEVGHVAGALAGLVAGAVIARELLMSAKITSERSRVRNRLWSCSFDADQIRGVGSVALTSGTGQSSGALVFYLCDGSAVPVTASASAGVGYRVERLQMAVAGLLGVPVVVRASRSGIDAALAELSGSTPGRFRRRGVSVTAEYLGMALAAEEADVEVPVRLRRGIFGDELVGPHNQPELVEFGGRC